jgi:Helix-turn-helix
MTNRKRKLKAAAVLEFGSQVEAAKALGLSEPRLSRLINGHDEPKPAEIKLFRERLGVELGNEHMEAGT